MSHAADSAEQPNRWAFAAAALFVIGATSTAAQLAAATWLGTAQHYNWRLSTGGLAALLAALYMRMRCDSWDDWQKRIGVWMGATAILAFVSVYADSQALAPRRGPGEVSSGPLRSAFDQPEMPMPSEGDPYSAIDSPFYREVLHQFLGCAKTKDASGTLKISVPDGKGYLVRLVAGAEGNDIGLPPLFIPPDHPYIPPPGLGKTRAFSIPVCGDRTVYELSYGAGAKWYGDRFTFGPTGTYGRADQVLPFKDGSVWTVSLSLRPGRNLSIYRVEYKNFTR